MAKEGRIPNHFEQWDLADNKGLTVREISLGPELDQKSKDRLFSYFGLIRRLSEDLVTGMYREELLGYYEIFRKLRYDIDCIHSNMERDKTWEPVGGDHLWQRCNRDPRILTICLEFMSKFLEDMNSDLRQTDLEPGNVESLGLALQEVRNTLEKMYAKWGFYDDK
jgi:hypothetical protein